jgi:DNA-binding beta-propeller fold protein YncE
MPRPREKGSQVSRTEKSIESLSRRTGVSALLVTGRRRGTGASSLRACGLALLATAFALLALSPGAASAATTTFCAAGSAAGQCDNPEGVAVDQSDGTVYVAELNNNRVSEFDEEGHFLRAFGFGVATGAAELQTCASSCGTGIRGSEPGEFNFPLALAVDSSSHEVYVSEASNHRVQKFSSSGGLQLAFGAAGSGEGEFSGGALPIAVDSSHHVWVGDLNRLEEFTTAGEYLAEVKLPGAGEIHALAVDSTGDFYVESSGLAGVQKFEPSGTPFGSPFPLDASGHPNALGIDPASGNLFVSDQLEPNTHKGTATLLEFSSSGKQLEAFGSGEVIGGPGGQGLGHGNALAFGDTAQRLYVVSTAGGESSAAQAFSLPEPGPLPVAGTTKADPIAKTSATFCAEVNPEGKSATAHFQYITEAAYKADGEAFGVGTESTAESTSLGEDFSPRKICQTTASPLKPATAYRFRLVASNENAPLPEGIKGQTASFETLPPAAIDSTSAGSVGADAATLEALVNPLGDATSYRFEYLTEARYLENQAAAEPLFSGATLAPPQPAPIGSGSVDVAVSRRVQGLGPHTTYHYRIVVSNAVSEAAGGPFAGPTHAFTTQTSALPGLPDSRQWEMVSPPDKRGGLIGTNRYGQIQTAPTGDAFAFATSTPLEGRPPGSWIWNQALAVRGPGGWSVRNINAPHQAATGLVAGAAGEYPLLSSDLSRAILHPFEPFEPNLSADATEQTLFVRTNFLGGDSTNPCLTACYRPLLTGAEGIADVPPGTEFGKGNGPEFLTATPDLSHVVLASKVALTESPLPTGGRGLYEWSADRPPAEQLRLVSVLPGAGAKPASKPVPGYQAASGERTNVRNTVSDDGSRVIWSESAEAKGQHLYLRLNAGEEQSPLSSGGECVEAEKACTLQLDTVRSGPGLGPVAAIFQAASADDSVIFFTDTQNLTAASAAQAGRPDLYEWRAEGTLGCAEPEGCLADLTPPGPGGEPADVLGLLPGASEDGSYLYFVANGDLAPGASPGSCSHVPRSVVGACNLYLRHDGVTEFIATLAGADLPDWATATELPGLTARVSPDGRWLAFMSQRQLTGYDNRDAVTGEPDEEVFLYHAAAATGGQGGLICASCNPTGARPLGELFGPLEESGVDGFQTWPASQGLAAGLPGWTAYYGAKSLYQPRYLSDSGRLFFNATDSLVPADTNGTGDVYQYEPVKSAAEAPPADTCSGGVATYSPAAEGCVDLISSGTSAEESGFLDASESGDDVFFFTNSRLSPQDLDSSRDVYDAHVCSAALPCPPAPPAAAVECEGDGCQQPAVPPNDPTPGTLTFQGPGNLTECPKGKTLKNGKCVKKSQPKKKKHKNGNKHKRKSNKAKKSAKGGGGAK